MARVTLLSDGDAAAPGEDGELTAADAAKVGELRRFVEQHGGSGTAVISYLGRVGARIVVVGADGAFGDAVVSGVEAGAKVCERAGIPVAGEWDRELSAALRPSAEDRRRMAGTGR
jgi:hypothetical protein